MPRKQSMGSLKTLGQFPPLVYRAFSKRKYAEQFMNGTIRFGNIYYYKRIEDENRRDRTEGESHVRYEGRDQHGMFASNAIYVLCCHRTMDAVKRNSLGNHVVLIRQPERFAEAISSAIENLPGKYFGGAEGCTVEYTKGREVENKLSGQDIVRLAYCQKPDTFSSEEEFRFVIIRKTSVGDFLTVPIEESPDYFEYTEASNKCFEEGPA